MKHIITPSSRNLALGSLLALLLPAYSVQMADHFADRPQVSGTVAVLTADTSGASLEPGETNFASHRNDTVWAQWTAPANGWATIDTLGTAFPAALITVYAGTAVNGLSCVARGYDPDGPTPASVRFPVAAGMAYQIVLDSSLWHASGPGTVNVRLVPGAIPLSSVGADEFAERTELTGSQAYGVAANHFASLDAFEPESFGDAEKTIWWQWTAPATGKAKLDTLDSDFDTTITVYAGDPDSVPAFSGLGPIVNNDNLLNSSRSRLEFQTEAGRTYQIAVDGGLWHARGNIVMHLELANNAAAPAIPGADGFASRGVLIGSNAAGVACNRKFSLEAFEPASGGNRRKSAWWEWTAPEDCIVVMDTLGSDFDTVLKVFKGAELETLGEMAFNDNIPGGTTSRLSFSAIKGSTYQIVVDGGIWWAEGNIVLNLNREASPEIDVQQPAGSNLTDGASKKSFGTVKIGAKSAGKTFTIRNTGTANLTGLAIGRTGATDFTVGSLTATSLAPGASATFKVTFSPRAKGTRTASVQIKCNDADESTFDIRVSGMGVR